MKDLFIHLILMGAFTELSKKQALNKFRKFIFDCKRRKQRVAHRISH